jgi:hypothetical protein
MRKACCGLKEKVWMWNGIVSWHQKAVPKAIILSHIWVTVDRVWIGDWIY